MKRGIIIDKKDNVGIVLENAESGETIDFGSCEIEATEHIKVFHKQALRDIEIGDSVIKYGQPIGYATHKIKKGDWVHIHNLDAEKLMK
mgnify:CR=1 FL=1